MIFVSAGHNSKSVRIKQDPGAVNRQGIKEGDITIEFRDLVCAELDVLKRAYVKDLEEENLPMYLSRVKTGNGSVVIEYHTDSHVDSGVTGTTGLVEQEADKNDRAFARDITNTNSTIMQIKNRGVWDERESHRGRLGLMREDGIICLSELFFLSNPRDLAQYHRVKRVLAKEHARIIAAYEDLIK